MDQAARGAAALEKGDYETAIKEYTSAIAANTTAVPYYIKRSVAHQRAGKHTEALSDAEIAVSLAYKRAKRELIKEAQQKRVVALYHNERYGDAQFVLDIVKRMAKDDKMVPLTENMVKKKLDALPEEDERRKVTVKEIPDVETPAPSAASTSSKTETSQASPTPQTTAPKMITPTPASKIRHDWYQNDKEVVVSLMAKGVPEDKMTVDIEAESLSISFPTVDNSDYCFNLDPLWAEIDPSTSSYRVTPTKVTITLRKKTSAVKWKALERKEGDPSSVETERATSAAPKVEKAPAYPTSSRHGVKDWDKVVASETGGKPGADDDDEVEGDETTAFFKKLYGNASPDVQRAMMKSYQESGGTVLSTDWSQVGSKTISPEPPTGMEAKKW